MTERSGGVASWGERLTRISAEITDVKRVVVVVVVVDVLMDLTIVLTSEPGESLVTHLIMDF